jgi:hypothetical protein
MLHRFINGHLHGILAHRVHLVQLDLGVSVHLTVSVDLAFTVLDTQ